MLEKVPSSGVMLPPLVLTSTCHLVYEIGPSNRNLQKLPEISKSKLEKMESPETHCTKAYDAAKPLTS